MPTPESARPDQVSQAKSCHEAPRRPGIRDINHSSTKFAKRAACPARRHHDASMACCHLGMPLCLRCLRLCSAQWGANLASLLLAWAKQAYDAPGHLNLQRPHLLKLSRCASVGRRSPMRSWHTLTDVEFEVIRASWHCFAITAMSQVSSAEAMSSGRHWRIGSPIPQGSKSTRSPDITSSKIPLDTIELKPYAWRKPSYGRTGSVAEAACRNDGRRTHTRLPAVPYRSDRVARPRKIDLGEEACTFAAVPPHARPSTTPLCEITFSSSRDGCIFCFPIRRAPGPGTAGG